MQPTCFSKNRRFIMGISIIGIVLLHTAFSLPSALTALRRTGYIYVDLFMLLSGYGLYMSLLKKEGLSAYYKRRFIRILPTYWILSCVFLLYIALTKGVLFSEIVGVLTTMSFWSAQKTVFSWFGSAIFAFYFVSPIVAGAVRHSKRPFVLFWISFLFVVPFLTTSGHIMAIARIPAFILGMCFAKLVVEGEKEFSGKRKLVLIGGGILGVIILGFTKTYFQPLVSDHFGQTYYLIFLPSVFIVGGLIVIWDYVGNMLDHTKCLHWVYDAISYLGNSTFEIYLVQSLLYMIVLPYLPKNNTSLFLLMIAAFTLGILFSKMITIMQGKINFKNHI